MTHEIDPGPCHRLLEPDEVMIEGDDVNFGNGRKWEKANNWRAGGKQVCGVPYRRRVIPDPPDGYAAVWAKHWPTGRQCTSLVIPDYALRIDGCDKEPRRWIGGCTAGITIAESIERSAILDILAFAFPIVPQPVIPPTEDELDQAAVERVNRILLEKTGRIQMRWGEEEWASPYYGKKALQLRLIHPVSVIVLVPSTDMDEFHKIAEDLGWKVKAD